MIRRRFFGVLAGILSWPIIQRIEEDVRRRDVVPDQYGQIIPWTKRSARWLANRLMASIRRTRAIAVRRDQEEASRDPRSSPRPSSPTPSRPR